MNTNKDEATIATKAGSLGRRMKIFGVITIILGLIAIATPAITGLSIIMTVGVLVIVGGILRMLWAFWRRSFGKGLLAFVIGGLTLMCGLILVTDPLVASGLLTILVGALVFADGVAEIVGAFSLPRDSGRGWLLIGGIVSIALGAMIWRQYPLAGSWAIGALLGVRLLFIGIVMITGGAALRAPAKEARDSA